MMRRLELFFVLLILIANLSAELKPVNMRALPRHTKSYKHYLVVLVHGMRDSKDTWDNFSLKSELGNLVGDPSFAQQIFAYSFKNPNSSYHENARQLGDRNNPENWLTKARNEFANAHPNLPEEQLPTKYILITHSMGSLAARSYIYSDSLAASGVDNSNFPYGFYENDVKKVIFLAPTHLGSSMADFILHYIASDAGYQKGPSGMVKDLINTLKLKNDTFGSAWGKAKNLATNKYNEYVNDLQTKSEEYLRELQEQYGIDPEINLEDIMLSSKGDINSKITFSEGKIKEYVTSFVEINYRLDEIKTTTTNSAIIESAEKDTKRQKDLLKKIIKEDLKSTLMHYYESTTSSPGSTQNKNNWLKNKIDEAAAKALEKLTENIYQEAKKKEEQIDSEIQKKSTFANWQELSAYISDLIAKYQELQSKREVSHPFDFKNWIDQKIQKKTNHNNWEELLAYIRGLKIGNELKAKIVEGINNRTDLDEYSVVVNSIVEQSSDNLLEKEITRLVREYTEFNNFAEFKTHLDSLNLESLAQEEWDQTIKINTTFANWEQLKIALKTISISAELKTALDKEIELKTGYKTWEELNVYIKNLSLEAYVVCQANTTVQEMTGFASIEELNNYLSTLDLQKEWNKYFLPIKKQMTEEGYYFNVELAVAKEWPLETKPTIGLYWHEWTKLDAISNSSAKDIVNELNEYRFRVKVTNILEFKSSINEIKEKMASLSDLFNPLNRLYPIITELDTSPIFSFPTVKILLEVNNYCASDQVKEFIDQAISQYFLKESIEGGAITSLLKEDPATQVLKKASLPDVYDPIQYTNIIPRGAIAFDARETEEFNQFFYGDLPALQCAFQEIAALTSVPFVSSMLANAYQIKLLTSAKYHRLPSGQARLSALLLSYSRGLFTMEGDGAVDINSLRGKGIDSLRGADEHNEYFETKELSNYIDRGFLEETLEAEAVCLLVEVAFKMVGGTTPPYVRGAIRLMPMFNFISIVVENKESILEDLLAHKSILKPDRSLAHIESSFFDTPLITLKNIYAVSGNEKVALSYENFQEKTDNEQTVTTIPIITDEELVYLPMAYNISVPRITLKGKLFDFAPQLATLEYSYNFAPFKQQVVDKWGNFEIENLLVAEGQNILSFRVTNKTGKTNAQFVRIIRSSTPLMASNIKPQPFSQINNEVVPISVDFYNAQFISNNIDTSQIDGIEINGQPVAKNKVELNRGYDDEYRNYVRVLTLQQLPEGTQEIAIRSHDTYGHTSYTRWTFTVDLTPPSIIIEDLPYFSNASTESLEIEYTLTDNISSSLQNIKLQVEDISGNVLISYQYEENFGVGAQKTKLVLKDEYNQALSDGLYILEISAADLAGNRTSARKPLYIDSIPPKIIEQNIDHNFMSKRFDSLTYSLSVDEPADIYLSVYNQDKNIKQTYFIEESSSMNSQYNYQNIFKFTAQEEFELSDGNYELVAIVNDSAGNSSKTTTINFNVDCTPPVAYGLNAEPMVLAKTNIKPYFTTIELNVQEKKTTIYGEIINKSLNEVVNTFSKIMNSNKYTVFEWDASDTNISKGAYLVKLTVLDEAGNSTNVFCEVIKDGITPQVSLPKDGTTISGIVSIIGKVSDSDWSNVKSFSNYSLYWSNGPNPLPTNLKNIDQNTWNSVGLDVPFINRKSGQVDSNISHRAAGENSLLGYWNTEALPAGEYTLLVIASEEELGATSGLVKTFVVDNSNFLELINPHAARKDNHKTIDFSVSENIELSFFNANKEANIGVEIIAPDGEIVDYFYKTGVKGLHYYGQPTYLQGEEFGVFVWQDNFGWHLRLNGQATKTITYNITIAGIKEIITVTGLNQPATNLKSGLLKMSGTIAAGTTTGFDFKLQQNIRSIYLNIKTSNQSADSVFFSGSALYLGAAKHNPKNNPYVIVLDNTESASEFSYSWSGKNSNGGYVDNGIYTLRVSAGGADGNGFKMTETTLNVKTPFSITKTTTSPADGRFNAFDKKINKVSVGYKNNKDVYLTAQVINAENNELISTLVENKKILGSVIEKKLSWNGAFPEANSTQRKIDGNYKIKLLAQAKDNSTNEILEYDNIAIFNSSDASITAQIEPIGLPVSFNGKTVQSTAGSSNYYWSARAEGKYTNPKPFKYRISASGEQLVSANPLVYFAGLYHRGFNTVKMNVTLDMGAWFEMHSRNDYYEGGHWESSTKITTNNPAIMTGKLGFSNRALASRCFDYAKAEIRATDGNLIDTLKIYDGDRISGGYWNTRTVNITGTSEKNIFKYTLTLGKIGGGSNDLYLKYKLKIELLDNIKYSRLTNRFYAWFGGAMKDHELSMDFSQYWNDLNRLGFVPSSYFQNGLADQYSEGISTRLVGVTINNTQVYYDQPGFLEALNELRSELQQENVDYGPAVTTNDTSYYNYLEDEYCEFIPMAIPVPINFANEYKDTNRIDVVKVSTNYTIGKIVSWPITEEELYTQNNAAIDEIKKQINPEEITNIDYTNPPFIIDPLSVDFGGLGRSLHDKTGVITKFGTYKVPVNEVFFLDDKNSVFPPNVIRENINLKIEGALDPDIEIAFDDGSTAVEYTSDQKITARYTKHKDGDAIQDWATENDPFLKNGLIDSTPIIFNAYTYAPETNYINIADSYFAKLNRPEKVVSQNIHPIDYYTFLEHNYWDDNSGYIVNPNLDLEKWDIAVYDQTGQINQDLEVIDIEKSSEDILNNRFKVRLKLDAIEKRYVRVEGVAAGPYEVLYYDGNNWLTIATGNIPVQGLITWWDVGRLNGQYTVALKVYQDQFGSKNFNITTRELFIGELLEKENNDPENKRVSSPYKRAEVFFHPNSYEQDQFITVTPVDLNELTIQNKPDLYTIGPIAEILPHGSEFPEADKRPTLVFRYSHKDLAELTSKGINIDNLSLHYLNENGEVEKANSEIINTDFGLEIRTMLTHFSPYAILEGEVFPLPKATAAYSMANDGHIKIYGSAKSDSVLEIIVDDDNVLGDEDFVKINSFDLETDDISTWMFNERAWSEDYINKLPPEERISIIKQRQSQLQKLEQSVNQNNLLADREKAKYQEAINQERENINNICNYISQQEIITTSSSREGDFNGIDVDAFKKYIGTSGVERVTGVNLDPQIISPTFNSCLPDTLVITNYEKTIEKAGISSRRYLVLTDKQGFYEFDVPLLNITNNTQIFVTYAQTKNITNRPVARINIGQDPEAPTIKKLTASRTVANEENKGNKIKIEIEVDEECRVYLNRASLQNEVVDTTFKNTLGNSKTLFEIDPSTLVDGKYTYNFIAIDSAGNSSIPWQMPLLVDTTKPSTSAITVPEYINPLAVSLDRKIKDSILDEKEVADYIVKIFYQGVLVADSPSSSFTFNPIFIDGQYFNGTYDYEIKILDQAGNNNLKTGSFRVDTKAPEVPEIFKITKANKNGIKMYWTSSPSDDLETYFLEIVNKKQRQISTYNLNSLDYYDIKVSENNFYEYNLYAIDKAKNKSLQKKSLITYVGDNFVQKNINYNIGDIVSLNKCTLEVPTNATTKNNLFVVQEIKEAEKHQVGLEGRKLLSPQYRLLASEQDTFTKELSVKFEFDPKLIEQWQLQPQTIKTAFWDGEVWSTNELIISEIDLELGTIAVKTPHFTDFAVIAHQKYSAYDLNSPNLSFETLRDGDFVDTTISINLVVNDTTTAVNTNNMYFLLDNVKYDIPSDNFVPDSGSGGKSGKITFNLNNIVGSILEGKHTLSAYIFDQANNTSNTTISFTNKQQFEIKEIMNVPNPFNEDGTHFTYQLSKPANSIEIKIFDTNGRLIKEIDNCSNDIGFNKTFWDGSDKHGQFVANDVYLYMVIVDGPDGRDVIKGKVVAIR
ncbi:hypothetical protein OAR19_00175 [bacterium]|nr:hypothetical protein [bacterium]